jgi:hypothetical protein
MTTVNMTAKQQQFFDYVNNYHKANGALPTVTQVARDLNIYTASAHAYYSALFLKGAFTNGQTLVAGNNSTRNMKPVRAINASELKIAPKGSLRKVHTPKTIAATISRLIASGNPAAKELAKALGL